MYKFSTDPQLSALCENLAARCGKARLLPENLSIFDLQPELLTTKPSVGGNGFIDGVDFDDLLYKRIFPEGKQRYTFQAITTYLKGLAKGLGKNVEMTQPYHAVSKTDYARFMDWFLPNGRDSKPFAVYQAMMIFVRSASLTWGEGFTSIIKGEQDFYIEVPIWGPFGIKEGKLVGLTKPVEAPPLALSLGVMMFETVDDPVLVRPDFYTALSVFVGDNPEQFPDWINEKKLLAYLRFTAPSIKSDLFWRRVKVARELEIKKRVKRFAIKEAKNLKQMAIDRIEVARSRGGPFLKSELSDMLESVVITRGNFARLVGKPDKKGRDTPNMQEAERLIEKISKICDERIAKLQAELEKLENKN